MYATRSASSWVAPQTSPTGAPAHPAPYLLDKKQSAILKKLQVLALAMDGKVVESASKVADRLSGFGDALYTW